MRKGYINLGIVPLTMDVSRWKHVAAAIVINLCLGAVYAFSIIISPFEGEFGWRRTETTTAFTIALLTFALSMIPAGKLQDKKGPRITVGIGSFLLGLGMILSSYTNSLSWLYMNYGLLVGLGIGFAYGAPIAACNKWFPDKKGLLFSLLWLSYCFGTAVGLMTIGQAKQVAVELAGMIDPQASIIVSALGGSNALGRIFWGLLGDKIGREKALTIDFLACFMALLIMSGLCFIQPLFVISIMVIGSCFGGFLAIYPAIISDNYESKNMGVNYGIMFTAFGAGSILGPIMASYSKDFHGSYLPAFHISAVLTALAMPLTFPLLHEKSGRRKT
ncbi:MAG: MFS transporter [Candidatus Bathyarchaeia archaeon]